MGRFQLHFAWYMASYTALMLASYLLWQAAGTVPAGGELLAASDFLIGFSTVAYPLYALIKAVVKRIMRTFGTRRRLQGGSLSGTEGSTVRDHLAA